MVGSGLMLAAILIAQLWPERATSSLPQSQTP